MSARDKLLALCGNRSELMQQVADEILADHAHELAEKIRQSEGSPPVHATKHSRLTYRWHARRNADLIDPEVTE